MAPPAVVADLLTWRMTMQAIRDYDDEYEVALKAVAEAAAMAQDGETGVAPMAIDDGEVPAGTHF